MALPRRMDEKTLLAKGFVQTLWGKATLQVSTDVSLAARISGISKGGRRDHSL